MVTRSFVICVCIALVPLVAMLVYWRGQGGPSSPTPEEIWLSDAAAALRASETKNGRNRGREFQAVVLSIDASRVAGTVFTEAQVKSYLGQPDEQRSVGTSKELRYRYTVDPETWTARLVISNDRLSEIGYSGAPATRTSESVAN